MVDVSKIAVDTGLLQNELPKAGEKVDRMVKGLDDASLTSRSIL